MKGKFVYFSYRLDRRWIREQ